MDEDKIKKLSGFYEEYLRCRGHNAIRLEEKKYDLLISDLHQVELLDHCCWMTCRIPELLKQGRKKNYALVSVYTNSIILVWFCFTQ